MTLTSLPPAFKGAGPTGAYTGTIGSWLRRAPQLGLVVMGWLTVTACTLLTRQTHDNIVQFKKHLKAPPVL